MQQKKSHNGNFKESIICYGCGQKGHIKRNCSVFKFKKSCLKIKNMISCRKFNNVKFNDIKVFNMICTIPFLEKNVDKSRKEKTNDKELEDEQISKRIFSIN